MAVEDGSSASMTKTWLTGSPVSVSYLHPVNIFQTDETDQVRLGHKNLEWVLPDAEIHSENRRFVEKLD